jgi:putative ABC transport system substrate-binding protein
MKAKRRVASIGVGLVAAATLLSQQPSRIYRIGLLMSRQRPDSLETDPMGEFPKALRDLGYVEGKNVVLEWRFADGHYDRFPVLAADLVSVGVDLIMTDSTAPALAARRATRTIPIVFTSAGDPVGNGLVESLAHPGGNATGVASFAGESAEGKQLDFLRTIVPGLSLVAVLYNGANPYGVISLKALDAVAAKAGVRVVQIEARTEQEIAKAFDRMAKERVRAFLLARDPFFFQQRNQIVKLALRQKLPLVGHTPDTAEAGGLMSYGVDPREHIRRAAVYVDKILKGANPGDLPVEQPTQFFFMINKKTAKALGLTIPPELLLQADKVIE